MIQPGGPDHGGPDGLLERSAELARMEEALADARAGEARRLVVESGAGLGKSRLLTALRRSAEASGVTVLAARGSELEQAFPFGVVRQLFEPELTDAAVRERLLSGSAAAAGAVFGTPGDDALEVQDTSFAALHGLFWLTLNVAAERPLLVVVDDLHWCDRPSLRFVAYLARRLEGTPTCLACGVRTGEASVDPVLLGEVVADPEVTSVAPGPLTREAVGGLLAERLGAADARFTEACHAGTGGNPLLLRQLIRSLESEGIAPDADHATKVREIGPRAVSRTVLLRLAKLDADAAEVARAVAILGEGAELSHMAALTGLDHARVADQTAELARAEILGTEATLDFVHPLVRDAVYRDLSPADRELRHAAAARMLAEAGASSEQVAAQLLATSRLNEPWVVETLHAAARSAVSKGAPDSAAAYLRRALDEPLEDGYRAGVLLELGGAELLSDGAAAARHLRAAYDALEDPEARGRAAAMLGRAQLFTGSLAEARQLAQNAAADLPESDDVRLELEALEHMTTFFGAGGVDRLEHLRAHRHGPGGTGPGERMLVSMAAYEWVCSGGTAAETSELALAALEGGYLTAADSSLLSFAAMAALIHADHPQALPEWDEMLAAAHRNGSLIAVSSVHLWRGYTLLRHGDLPAAQKSLEAAADEHQAWGFDVVAKAHSAAFLASALRERGDLEGARARLTGLEVPQVDANFLAVWLFSNATLLLAEGYPEEALEECLRLRGLCERFPDTHQLWWRGLAAEAHDRLGRTEEALDLAREELEITRAYGAADTLARTLRVLGTIEREDGIDRLREAIGVLEGSQSKLEMAKAHAALGSALRRNRERTEAREPLRRALELADACGADGLAGHVRSELYATGVRPRTTALSGRESLTASELRVASLATEGQSNRDIAQTLYVTPKTVEVHLTSVYRKLGVRSRRELPQAMAA